MKILLTGGLGFIGKNFIKNRPRNWHVTSLDIIEDKKFQSGTFNTRFYKVDLASSSSVEKLSRRIKEKFDVSLILAANGDPALSVKDPLWDLKMTTVTLINTLTCFRIEKCVYLSSGAVYDGYKGRIGPEKPIIATLPYALSHKLAEDYVRYYERAKIIKHYTIIRFFGAYGPFEPERKIYTKLVRSLAIKGQEEFTIKGDGYNLIDAMYVKDAISGLVKVIESKKTDLIADFCKGEHPTISKLVLEAAQVFGKKIKIKHEGSVPEYNRFYASNSLFEKYYKFKPKTNLKDGLQELKEYIENE